MKRLINIGWVEKKALLTRKKRVSGNQACKLGMLVSVKYTNILLISTNKTST